MGLEDVLKGYTPQELEDDSGFKILKGTYRSAIMFIKLEQNAEWGDRYQVEFLVNETLDGDEGVGRKFWKRFNKDDEGMKGLLDVLFTAGVDVPRATVEEFEQNLFKAADAEVVIRAWGWTPEKDIKGNLIAEDERVARQQFKVVSPKKVKVKGTKKEVF